MSTERGIPAHALTLEQWRTWNLTATRPFTDPPIGATTAGKRDESARASDIHTDHSPIPPKVDPKLERASALTASGYRRARYEARRTARNGASVHGEIAQNGPGAAQTPPGYSHHPQTRNGAA